MNTDRHRFFKNYEKKLSKLFAEGKELENEIMQNLKGVRYE